MDEERRRPGRPRKLVKNADELVGITNRIIFWNLIELDIKYLESCQIPTLKGEMT